MRCPYCPTDRPGNRHEVKATRRHPDGRIVRRRHCKDCHHDFETTEQLSPTTLTVRKSDGRTVPFDRNLVGASIEKAAVRKIDEDHLDSFQRAVVADVYSLAADGPIPSQEIGDAVLRHLRPVDPASQVRFSLVYVGRRDRQDGRTGWRNVQDFIDWLYREYPELKGERPLAPLVDVVKRNGVRERYDRSKLESSIAFAWQGRGSTRGVESAVEDVATKVEQELGDQPVVTSGQIATDILRVLRRTDKVAYLRYASTAKGYRSPRDYLDEAVALRRDNRSSRSPMNGADLV